MLSLIIALILLLLALAVNDRGLFIGVLTALASRGG